MKPIVFEERKSKNSLGFTEKNNQFNVDASVDMTVKNLTDETRNRMLEKEIARKRCRNARRKVESK